MIPPYVGTSPQFCSEKQVELDREPGNRKRQIIIYSMDRIWTL